MKIKSIAVCSLLALAAFSARAELLYFQANAFAWDGDHLFDYVQVGVAKNGDPTWDGAGQRFLQVKGNVASAETADYLLADDPVARYTATGFADISDYLNSTDESKYTFYIEAYAFGVGDAADTLVWGYSASSAKGYDYLKANEHTFADTMPSYLKPWTIPEPTSGLLLLAGLAVLSLRRRKVVLPTANCQLPALKAGRIALVLLAFSCSASFAGIDDTLVSFSTKGPDTYLDGTTVKDGECYALVWTRDGATFAGLAADGTAVGADSRVVVFAPVAKGGCCPPVLFELDAELAKSYEGGRFGIYLLDTRLATGAVGGLDAKGAPVAVNGYGSVASAAGSAIGESSASRVSVTAKSALPADAPKPQITAIKLVGDKVFLTVKGTLPCLQYAAREVSPATDSQLSTANSSSAPTQGATSPDVEITVIAPKKGSVGLYSVGRK